MELTVALSQLACRVVFHEEHREAFQSGRQREICIGGKGGAFPVLHYDGLASHAFLMQIYGRKKFILYAPEHAHTGTESQTSLTFRASGMSNARTSINSRFLRKRSRRRSSSSRENRCYSRQRVANDKNANHFCEYCERLKLEGTDGLRLWYARTVDADTLPGPGDRGVTNEAE
jgi:hypothetical protein